MGLLTPYKLSVSGTVRVQTQVEDVLAWEEASPLRGSLESAEVDIGRAAQVIPVGIQT